MSSSLPKQIKFEKSIFKFDLTCLKNFAVDGWYANELKLQLKREQVVLLLAVLGSGAEDLMAEDRMAQAGFERVIDAFFHYANEPADGVYEFGYNRGNAAHHTARYEQSNGEQFRTKVQTKFNFFKN